MHVLEINFIEEFKATEMFSTRQMILGKCQFYITILSLYSFNLF
jgi:hypothetical protein